MVCSKSLHKIHQFTLFVVSHLVSLIKLICMSFDRCRNTNAYKQEKHSISTQKRLGPRTYLLNTTETSHQ